MWPLFRVWISPSKTFFSSTTCRVNLSKLKLCQKILEALKAQLSALQISNLWVVLHPACRRIVPSYLAWEMSGHCHEEVFFWCHWAYTRDVMHFDIFLQAWNLQRKSEACFKASSSVVALYVTSSSSQTISKNPFRLQSWSQTPHLQLA